MAQEKGNGGGVIKREGKGKGEKGWYSFNLSLRSEYCHLQATRDDTQLNAVPSPRSKGKKEGQRRRGGREGTLHFE